MFFSANHKEAAHRLDDARQNGDTLGMMIALAQFDECARVKHLGGVKDINPSDTINKEAIKEKVK
jgi:hypothetical protein